MIVHLQGAVFSIADNNVILDVNGIGYQLLCSRKTIDSIADSKEIVHLFTVLNVREDAWTLYGFATLMEKTWFQLLISVQGVGGRAALSILSSIAAEDMYSAFLSGDSKIFEIADGVGAKLSARIISELKDKVIGKTELADAINVQQNKMKSSVVNDVVSALVNLGYSKIDIHRAISTMDVAENAEFDQLFKHLLKQLSAGA